MKHSAFVLVAAAALLTAAPSCTTTEPPTPEPSVSASAPEQLGEGKLIFDFSQAIVTETEEDVVTVASRPANPNEFGLNNQRVRSTLTREETDLLISQYTKTGPNTAKVSTISTSAEQEAQVKQQILPHLNTITSDNIIRMLNFCAGDGCEEYELTFTSPTTATAVVTEGGGTFCNTIKNVNVTYVPAEAATTAETAAPAAPALKAPATLANGTWLRVDYSNVEAGEPSHDWLYMLKGKPYILSTEHPATSVPAAPKKLKDQEGFYLDNKGRGFCASEKFLYRTTDTGFQLRVEIPTRRNVIMLVGDYSYDGDWYNFSEKPINVILDKTDAKSISGTASGYYGRDMGFGRPKTISRVTIFR